MRLRFDLANSLGFASDATTTEALGFFFWRYPNGFAVVTPDSETLWMVELLGVCHHEVFFVDGKFLGYFFDTKLRVQVCHDLTLG